MSESTDHAERDWIIISGQPVDTAKGGGFEFFGPFTKPEADRIAEGWREMHRARSVEFEFLVQVVQLLSVSR